MKKIGSMILTTMFIAALLTGCGSKKDDAAPAPSDQTAGGEKGQLNLFTWEGMFPQELLDDFEAQSGYRINYVNFDYDETMLAKLEASNGGDYDLVIADDYIIETVIAEKLAQPLETSKIENYSNIDAAFQGQFYDPEDQYTIPFGSGVQTIVYDPAQVDIDIKGYEDLWDGSLADSVGIIANYRVIDGMALKIAGESYNTEDLDKIQTAGDLLKDLAPNIRLIKDDNIQDDLISGEISAAVMYTSQVTMAKLANPDLKVVYPEEGIGFGIMAGFIPSEAPNAEAAYAFIDYLLDAENAASYFEYLGYYSTNAAANEHLSDEMRELLTIPEGYGDNMEMIQNIGGEAEQLHSTVWVEFKTAAGQ